MGNVVCPHGHSDAVGRVSECPHRLRVSVGGVSEYPYGYPYGHAVSGVTECPQGHSVHGDRGNKLADLDCGAVLCVLFWSRVIVNGNMPA